MKACCSKPSMPLIRMGSARQLRAQLNLLNPGLVGDQGQGFLQERGQVDFFDVGLYRRTGETQQVFNDHGGPLDAGMDLFGALLAKLRGGIVFHDELGGGGADRQGIADFVGDAAGHHPQGGQFLGLEQLRLKFAALRQVPAHRHDPGGLGQVVLHGGKDPGDRNAAAIPGFQVPFHHLGLFAGLEVGKDRSISL